MQTEQLQRRREAHHKALEIIAAMVGCDKPGLKLWRELRRIENTLYPICLNYTNGENGIDMDKWEAAKDDARARLAKVFGGTVPQGVRINSDPRGHMLKLDCDKATVPQGMERDWGGDGILTAEIN
jgi:hypothetical protein